MTIRPVWTIGPGRFWQALYPSLLSITMVYPEKVRTQFLSLRQPIAAPITVQSAMTPKIPLFRRELHS